MNKTIDFSTNWNNKLACTYFPTYRILSDKYKVGDYYTIRLRKGKEHLPVKMVEIVQIIPMPLEKVTNTVALIDTGYPLDEFKKIVQSMYGKDKKGNEQDINTLPFGWIMCKTIKSAIQ